MKGSALPDIYALYIAKYLNDKGTDGCTTSLCLPYSFNTFKVSGRGEWLLLPQYE